MTGDEPRAPEEAVKVPKKRGRPTNAELARRAALKLQEERGGEGAVAFAAAAPTFEELFDEEPGVPLEADSMDALGPVVQTMLAAGADQVSSLGDAESSRWVTLRALAG